MTRLTNDSPSQPEQDSPADRFKTSILMHGTSEFTVKAWSPVDDATNRQRYLTIRQTNSVTDKNFTFVAPDLQELRRLSMAIATEIVRLGANEVPPPAPDAHLDDVGD